MPSSDLMCNTLQIGIENKVKGFITGTMFVVNVDNKQYIVTASHLFDDMNFPEKIKIFHPDGWNDFPVKLVGKGNSAIPGNDIAVLMTNTMLVSPEDSLKLDSAAGPGMQVYFMGFPLGYHTITNFQDSGFSIVQPLVKSGVFSGHYNPPGTDANAFLIDGHNNQGFSGGPVAKNSKDWVERMKNMMDLSGEIDVKEVINSNPTDTDFTVIGVVSSFLDEYIPNKYSEGNTISNSGIMVCSPIGFAQKLIRENPIGFDLG